MIANEVMVEPQEMLVTRRPRRSTAGNRMEAVLAEMNIETNVADSVEEDADFVNDKDEQDEFGSDFESTDEEAATEILEAAVERAVQEEERRIHRDARSRLEKATAAAHARHSMTFNPQTHAPPQTPKPKEPRRRVLTGASFESQNGKALQGDRASPKKRHSQRKHTVLNTSATVTRMKESEERKAAAPKKVKMATKTWSQSELITRALDNEEGNTNEHKNYLKIEEEKRRHARVVRATVTGPLLRWVSRCEEVKVTVQPSPVPYFSSQHPFPLGGSSTTGSIPYGQGIPLTYPAVTPSISRDIGSSMSTVSSSLPTAPAAQSSSTHTTPSHDASQTPLSPPTPDKLPVSSPLADVTKSPQSSQATASVPSNTVLQTTEPANPTVTAYNPYLVHLQVPSAFPAWLYALSPQQHIERTEKVNKNYVILESDQYDGAPRLPWSQMMTSMFGDHVQWDEVKVFTGKSRPLSRPRQLCSITGLHAKYLDPRTGVPYANADAFRVLSSILEHEYIWSPELKCYVGRADANPGRDSTQS